ncbi:hypothetical protein WMY93_023398 [Mugilogobius chulae]|uniref:Fibronectin type-III domain-containing protein n=1 Tax=Mugilogobius chulae TaxID=88201 RepID=A0AAW0NF85_9GOBI
MPLNQSTIDGYQVRFWRTHRDPDEREHKVVVSNKENHTRLDGLQPDSHYFIEIRGFNSAGHGPPSDPIQVHTKKSPPKQAPKVSKKFIRGYVNITWEGVKPQEDEAPVNEYRVLYRKQGHSTGSLFTTSKLYIDLPVYNDGKYVVEVRAHSEGGDGPVAQIEVLSGSAAVPQPLRRCLLLLLTTLLCLNL